MPAETSAVAARPAEVIPAQPPAAPAGSSRLRLVKNVLLLFSSQVASWTFALLWLFVVPRRLGPTAIGEFVIATSITAILGTFVNQGAGTLLTKDIARDPQVAGRLVGGTLLMRMACVLPAFVLTTVYSTLLHFSTEQTVLVWLATLGMLAASLSGAFQAAFTGLERMGFNAYANVIGNGLASILGIAVVLGGGGIVALMALESALSVVVLLLNLRWARSLFALTWRNTAGAVPYIVRGGMSYWIGGLFFVAYLWIDSVLLSIMVPARVVGWYGAPTQLFASILMVCGVLCTAWFPRMATAYKDGPQRLKEIGMPAVETVIVVSLPIAAGVVLVSKPVVQLIGGPAFSGAVPVLAILGLVVVPTFFNMVAYQVLLASNRQVAWIKVVGVATLLNIVLNVVLIPRFQAGGNGAIGAALSLLLSELFEFACALLLVSWLLEALLGGRVLRAASATALMAGAVWLVAPFGLVAQVGVGIVCFGIFGIALRVASNEELTELRTFGMRLRPRRSEVRAG